MSKIAIALLLTIGWLTSASAVVIDTSGALTYQTTEPTNTDISGWTTGWGSSGITGWDYVGQIGDTNGASAVYLGNGWVITAAHVGTGNFVLGGVTYDFVVGSQQSLTSDIGQTDLVMFRIATSPSLPVLSVTTTDPTTSPVVIIGYGKDGSRSETWAENIISYTSIPTQVTTETTTYTSYDFNTLYNNNTNKGVLIDGDSGGGAFTYNASTGTWQLAGLNEAVDRDTNDSYFVQLSSYSSQINTLVAIPEPHEWMLLGFGILVLAITRKIRDYSRRS